MDDPYLKTYKVTYRKQFIFSWLFIKSFTKYIKANDLKDALVKALDYPNISQGHLLSNVYAIDAEREY